MKKKWVLQHGEQKLPREGTCEGFNSSILCVRCDLFHDWWLGVYICSPLRSYPTVPTAIYKPGSSELGTGSEPSSPLLCLLPEAQMVGQFRPHSNEVLPTLPCMDGGKIVDHSGYTGSFRSDSIRALLGGLSRGCFPFGQLQDETVPPPAQQTSLLSSSPMPSYSVAQCGTVPGCSREHQETHGNSDS